MKTLFKPLLWGILILSLTFSCKSNSDYLKTTTRELNKLTEAMSNTKYEAEFDRLVSDYNKLMKDLPTSIQEMSEEEVANLDGGNDYLAALEFYNQVYMDKSRSFAFADNEQPISLNEDADSYEDIEYEFFDDNGTETEDNYILTPGVTYITTSSSTSTDELGGKVSLKMEFTIYKDGSASGNLIETNSKDSYGNTNSYEHPVEGTWELVSKHDKRFLLIELVLESEDYYNTFTYYISENLDAYANDLNTRPVRLERKDEQDKQSATVDESVDELKKLLEEQNKTRIVPFSSLMKLKKNGRPDTMIAIDLGLPSGLKWATCNVGASEPEESGDYFAWGETEPHYISLDPLTEITIHSGLIDACLDPLSWRTGKSGYNWASYQWCGGSSATMTKYNRNSSDGPVVDRKTSLEENDDAAKANWGDNWRMPTRSDYYELKDHCTWTWTTQNGVNGMLITGPNGNSIFLPATGKMGSSLLSPSEFGYYWTSSRSDGRSVITENHSCAYSFVFGERINDSTSVKIDDEERCDGITIRPVSE